MNAALCVSQEDHGSRQLGAEAGAAADLHLPVTPIWALPLLRGSRPHDSFRLPVRRGDRLIILHATSLEWSDSPAMRLVKPDSTKKECCTQPRLLLVTLTRRARIHVCVLGGSFLCNYMF